MHRYRLPLICLSLIGATAAALPAGAREARLSLKLLNHHRSMDVAFKPYMVALSRKIEDCWLPGQRKLLRKAKIRFDISGDGQLTNLHVQRSSGEETFDQRAESAISKASPFDQPPLSGGLKIEAKFTNCIVVK
jgi:TonB family protein